MSNCRAEGELRAFLDAELPAEKAAAVEAHLASCAACRERLAGLETDDEWVRQRLSIAAPGEAEVSSTSRALARLQRRIDEQSTWKEWMGTMVNQMKRHWRPLAAGLVLLVMASLLTLEPVQVAASELLSIFRVQQFAAIPIGPDQEGRIEELAEMLEGNLVLPEPVILQEPTVKGVESLEAAAAAVGYEPRTPDLVPSNLAPGGIIVNGRGEGYVQLDLESARALFEAVGMDPALLPDSLEGEPLDFTLNPMVTQTWLKEERVVLTFLQGPSPEVDYPDEVDPAALAEAGFQVLGMDEEEARRLSRAVDWTNTLAIPIPTDIVSYQEVPIDGATGLLLNTKYDQHGAHSALVWGKDGMIYCLQGNMSTEQLLDVADSIP